MAVRSRRATGGLPCEDPQIVAVCDSHCGQYNCVWMRQSTRAKIPVPQTERDALLVCFGALRSVRYTHPEITSAAVLDALDAVQADPLTSAPFYSDKPAASLPVTSWLVMLDAVDELRGIHAVLVMDDRHSREDRMARRLLEIALDEFGLTQTPAWFKRYEAFVNPGWEDRQIDKRANPVTVT